VSENKSGVKLTDENFASLDATTFKRDGEGNIIWGDFLQFRVLTEVEFNPIVLNGNGVATIYLNLQEGFKLEDIEFTSIRLNGEIKPISDKGYSKNPIADYDADGDMEFMVKFSRKEISRLLEKGDDLPVTITGQLKSSKALFGETKVTVK
jgi:pectate disaccharide-lyase